MKSVDIENITKYIFFFVNQKDILSTRFPQTKNLSNFSTSCVCPGGFTSKLESSTCVGLREDRTVPQSLVLLSMT